MSFRILSSLLIAFTSTVFAQETVQVPIQLEASIPVAAPYDDTELQNKITTIQEAIAHLEARIAAVEDGVPEPTPNPDPGVTPNAFFDSLVSRPDHLASFHFRSQTEIDARSVNPDKYDGTPTNEQIQYDVAEDAAKLVISTSIGLENRVRINFPEVSSGNLLAVWDYKPSIEWHENNTLVNTHKMFMWPSASGSEGRMLEQRFMYNIDQAQGWLIDTRPYIAADNSGSYGRLLPWNEYYSTVGEWHRFYSLLNYTDNTYTLKVRDSSGVRTIYDAVAVPGLVPCNEFVPTWLNTSQGSGESQGPFTHGWLRNVVILHDASIDLSPIMQVEL